MMSDIFLEHPDQTFQRLTDNHYHLKCEYDRLKSEHAKLEAANKVLRDGLMMLAGIAGGSTTINSLPNIRNTAIEALKAADEIMKENG